MKAPSHSCFPRALGALRRWLKDAWLARVTILDWLRGWGRPGRLAAWEASGRPRPGVKPELQFLESRETPDDVFGLLGTPLLGTGLALLGGPLLTPAAALAGGWTGGQAPAAPTHVASTDGSRTPGVVQEPPAPAGLSVTGGDPTVAGTSAAPPAASFASSSSGGQTATADDPFAGWLDDVGAALDSPKRPAAAPNAGGGGGGGGGGGTGGAAPATNAPQIGGGASFSGPSAPSDLSLADAGAAAARPTPTAQAAALQAAPATPATPAAATPGAAPASTAAFLQAFGRTRLAFEPNVGQTSSQVALLSHGPGFETFLTGAGAVLSLAPPGGAPARPGQAPAAPTAAADVLTLSFAGGDAAPQVYGTDPLPSASNYFIGDDPSKWLADVPNYAGVVYKNVYPGVDVQFHGDAQKELEYDFVVAPGADLSQVKVSWQGARSVQDDGQGNLLVTTASGRTLTETAPSFTRRPTASAGRCRAATSSTPMARSASGPTPTTPRGRW